MQHFVRRIRINRSTDLPTNRATARPFGHTIAPRSHSLTENNTKNTSDRSDGCTFVSGSCVTRSPTNTNTTASRVRLLVYTSVTNLFLDIQRSEKYFLHKNLLRNQKMFEDFSHFSYGIIFWSKFSLLIIHYSLILCTCSAFL